MKALLFAVLLLCSIEVTCQESQLLRLPKPEEIDRIEISNTSNVHWYKAEELLRLLPEFVASEGTYVSKIPLQRGTFLLKNGKKITWMAAHTNSILLYEGSREHLYVLRKENAGQGPFFRIWDEKGKEGFIDLEGKIVIEPQFEAVQSFSEGLAAVRIDGKWGYIDRAGKVVIEPTWKDNNGWFPAVMPFAEGRASVIEYAIWDVKDDSNYWTYRCGYIDRTGKYIIPPKKRQSCASFKNGIAQVAVDYDDPEYENGKTPALYFDAEGKRTVLPRAQNCREKYEFSEGLALAYSEKEKRYDGYVNEKCEYVFNLPKEIIAYSHSSNFSSGRAIVYRRINNSVRFGYIDPAGKVAVPFQFEKAEAFSDGLAYVENEKREKFYIGPSGQTVVKSDFVTGASFSGGLAYQLLRIRTIGEKPTFRNIYGYMDRHGKYVWISPGGEAYMGKEWIEKNYVGPQKFNFKP